MIQGEQRWGEKPGFRVILLAKLAVIQLFYQGSFCLARMQNVPGNQAVSMGRVTARFFIAQAALSFLREGGGDRWHAVTWEVARQWPGDATVVGSSPPLPQCKSKAGPTLLWVQLCPHPHHQVHVLKSYNPSTSECDLARKKNQILPFSATWMDLEDKKDKYSMISLICEL